MWNRFVQLFLVVWYPNPSWFRNQKLVSAAVQRRVDHGLVPWPTLDQNDYLNTIIGRCVVCQVPIFGGQFISMSCHGDRCVLCKDIIC